MLRIVSVLALLALVAAAAWSVILARADAAFRAGTPEGVEQAIAQMPGNAAYLAFGALQADYDSRDSTLTLERIARLNPTVSAPRIRLGLAAEQHGDLAAAEHWLREAYAVDHQFEPRWTLANFYLRQRRADDFWMWIRSALEVSYGDRRPAFDLCWHMSTDATEILARAIPNRDAVASDYLSYLLERKHPEALAAAAKNVRDQNLLLAVTDVLLENSRYADVVEVWRQLGRNAPTGVTAPNFEEPQTGHGFDWRLVHSEGVTHLTLESGRGHRIRLSGKQPENTELLRQMVGGLRPGQNYELSARFSGDGGHEGAGLEWRIAGEEWVPSQWDTGPEKMIFRAPAETAALVLAYRRLYGTVREAGTFDVHDVRIEMVR